MALEAIVYQYKQDLFGHNNGRSSPSSDHHLYSSYDHNHSYLLDTQLSGEVIDWPFDANYYTNIIDNNNVWDNYNISPHHQHHHHQDQDQDQDQDHDHLLQWGNNSSDEPQPESIISSQEEVIRPKRRRARTRKKEDIESQRMTHIAVERNRRKQMNDYLNELRSIMPHSYVQRGDQASIVGGAINFVKELEQSLQWLSARKQMNDIPDHHDDHHGGSSTTSSLPFGEFFTFPQYSTTAGGGCGGGGGGPISGADDDHHEVKEATGYQLGGGCSGGGGSGESAADVEVGMVESHALVKIRTKQPPKQLSKLVGGLQGLRLTILHLNTTKVDGVAFYCFSVKVEEESRLSSVDEIASAVYQLLSRIQDQGSTFN